MQVAKTRFCLFIYGVGANAAPSTMFPRSPVISQAKQSDWRGAPGKTALCWPQFRCDPAVPGRTGAKPRATIESFHTIRVVIRARLLDYTRLIPAGLIG